ncbi:MAG: hypothetical protein ABFC34_16025 [Methanobacterium sp.]
MNHKNTIRHIFDNIDKYLAISFIVLGVIASFVLLNYNINLVPAPIAILIFSVLYLINKNNNLEELFHDNFSKRQVKILFITIFILINLSLISVIFRPELYSRPLLYFIFISIASGLLAFTIMKLPSDKKYEFFALFIIILIGLLSRLIQQLLFPSLLGADPWVHEEFTNTIMSVGHLVSGFAYSRLPTMHILIAATSFISGLTYKWSSIFAVLIPQLVSFIVIYLIGRMIFNPKIGLLAALLLCISANFISLGFWIHPTAFALIASTFLLFYLIKEDKNNSVVDASIKILFAFLVVTAHMQVALAIFIVLLSFWVGKLFFSKIKDFNLDIIYSNKAKYIFVILFVVLMFSWWIYVANKIELPFNLVSRALEHDPSKITVVSTSMIKIPYYQYLINVMPYLFFYGFSIVGFLYSVSKKSTSNYFALTLSGIVLLAVPFLLLESSMSGFLAERWIYAAQLFMSIPVAVGVFIVLNTKKNKAIKSIFVIALISTFVFVNVINPSANIDNSQLSDSVVRYSHTQSELQSIITIQNISNDIIYTDFINTLPFSENQSSRIDKQLKYKQFSKLYGLVLIRSTLLDSAVYGVKLDYNPINEFSFNNTFDRVYDSGSDIAFLNKNKKPSRKNK